MEMKTFLPATFLLLVATPFCLVSGQITRKQTTSIQIFTSLSAESVRTCVLVEQCVCCSLSSVSVHWL